MVCDPAASAAEITLGAAGGRAAGSQRNILAVADGGRVWGDCPQARALLEGLTGVGHVMADAAHAPPPAQSLPQQNVEKL